MRLYQTHSQTYCFYPRIKYTPLASQIECNRIYTQLISTKHILEPHKPQPDATFCRITMMSNNIVRIINNMCVVQSPTNSRCPLHSLPLPEMSTQKHIHILSIKNRIHIIILAKLEWFDFLYRTNFECVHLIISVQKHAWNNKN